MNNATKLVNAIGMLSPEDGDMVDELLNQFVVTTFDSNDQEVRILCMHDGSVLFAQNAEPELTHVVPFDTIMDGLLATFSFTRAAPAQVHRTSEIIHNFLFHSKVLSLATEEVEESDIREKGRAQLEMIKRAIAAGIAFLKIRYGIEMDVSLSEQDLELAKERAGEMVAHGGLVRAIRQIEASMRGAQ